MQDVLACSNNVDDDQYFVHLSTWAKDPVASTGLLVLLLRGRRVHVNRIEERSIGPLSRFLA